MADNGGEGDGGVRGRDGPPGREARRAGSPPGTGGQRAAHGGPARRGPTAAAG